MFICAKGLLRMTTVRAPKNYNGCMCRGEVRKRARMQGMELQSGVAPNAMSIARLQPWPNADQRAWGSATIHFSTAAANVSTAAANGWLYFRLRNEFIC